MPRIIVNEFLSLDGVAQAPGGPDEDRDGGFRHGGWHMPYMDDIAGAWVDKGMTQAGGLLLGRRTYDIFAAYWPDASEAEQEIARPLNEMPKYVVSRTLKDRSPGTTPRCCAARSPRQWRTSAREGGEPPLLRQHPVGPDPGGIRPRG